MLKQNLSLSSHVSLVVGALLLSSLTFQACSKAPDRPSFRGIPSEPINGSFKIALVKEDRSAEQELAEVENQAHDVAEEVGCKVDVVEPIVWESGALSEGLAGNYHVTFNGCDFDQGKLESAMDSFSKRNAIATVEAEAKIRLSVTENDPGKASQSFLKNINRDATCDLLSGKPREITVAVIDSGVDEDHPDLVDAFKKDASGKVIGANFVGKGSRGAPDANWDDQNGHGTHVAGLVAATSNNNQGVVGVAGCANVKIIPIRVMGSDGAGSSIEIDRGVQWAIAHGADIINLSLGGNVRFRSPQDQHPNALYREAAARGVVVFAASGNDGVTLGRDGGSGFGYIYSYPASYDHVISVAASNSRDQLTGFSNRGETVDIAAPGEQVLATYMGGGYQRLSGTSMASPVAAGAYALALSASGAKDRFDPDQVEEIAVRAVKAKNLRGVLSQGVLDTKLLTELLKEKLGSTPTLPEMPEEKPEAPEVKPEQPTVPEKPIAQPEQPAPAPSKDMVFPGLKEGQVLRGALPISVTNWPKGKTARIHLYWVTANDPEPRSFTVLDRDNLNAAGTEVKTSLAYYFYGEGQLVAEAVDAEGNRVQLSAVALRGL